MDPCEYIYNQQVVMRRLLSFLRQSQSSCSDTDCFNDFLHPGQNLPATSTPENFMMMTVFCVIIGLFLFMTRPTSIRSNDYDTKPTDRSGPDNNGQDPSQSAH